MFVTLILEIYYILIFEIVYPSHKFMITSESNKMDTLIVRINYVCMWENIYTTDKRLITPAWWKKYTKNKKAIYDWEHIITYAININVIYDWMSIKLTLFIRIWVHLDKWKVTLGLKKRNTSGSSAYYCYINNNDYYWVKKKLLYHQYVKYI